MGNGSSFFAKQSIMPSKLFEEMLKCEDNKTIYKTSQNISVTPTESKNINMQNRRKYRYYEKE